MENYFDLHFDIKQINAVSNLGLAHIGDAVYELMCRSYLCCKGDKTVKNLHKDSVAMVKAPTQAKFAEKLQPYLTEQEQDWFRRGKNAHVHVPKSASREEYAKATGVEALFGALYLAGKTDRANELFNLVMEEMYGI